VFIPIALVWIGVAGTLVYFGLIGQGVAGAGGAAP